MAKVGCPPSSHLCLVVAWEEAKQQGQERLRHLPQPWLEHLPAPMLPSLPNCCSSCNGFIPGCPGAAAISLLEFITPLALKFYKPPGR